MNATAVNVAQAISRVIEEAETDGLGAFATPNINITEVGAQLHHDSTGRVESFYLKTSDGKEFRVSVEEV